MRTRSHRNAVGNDLRETLPVGVKKLKKHGKDVIAVLDKISDRGLKQLGRNARALATGLTSDAPVRKK
ncbi:MAG: hypothetical protein Q7R59_01385 [bacterium]|nr:hypothetical protein [bacterium]